MSMVMKPVKTNVLRHSIVDIRNGKHKSEVDSNNVSPQLDAGNYISAQEGYIISDGIQTGILQKAAIANECIDTVEEGVDDNTGEKRKKGKRRHGKTKKKKKKKHKKHHQKNYPVQADIQIENNLEDHDIHADLNNKDQFNTTCISELYSQAENVESHRESKRKHKKGNRKDKKRSYEEGLVEESEGTQHNIRNPLRNSDRYAGNYLGATSMNVMLPQPENENKQDDDKRTQKKKKRREKKTRQEENFCDDKNEPGNLEINAE
ncbi:hypothetical protein CHS0354_027307 [Potamilus streckersoni]|uniref:Uncharacterized protein n=1 Tax=Potamilus streckersoni TaxID=2493646 RepID=A0AAE0TEV4_9BIVA|nr:hypothetical protein CHS0354_027307 [Potamilus streckersoni]